MSWDTIEKRNKCRDATESMEKNCLKFGYKYYRGKKIEGD